MPHTADGSVVVVVVVEMEEVEGVLDDVEEDVSMDEEVLVDDEVVDGLVELEVVKLLDVLVEDGVLVVVTARVSTRVATSARALCPPSAVTCASAKTTSPAGARDTRSRMLGVTVRLSPGASVPTGQE